MSGGAPKAPDPPPPPPMPTDPQVQKDAANARLAGKRRKGFGASILAGESSSLQTPADYVSKDTLGA